MVRLPSLLLVALIRAYQSTLGSLLPPRCRFYPSCSEYAIQSIRESGVLRGGAAAAWRVVRCGPWSRGGVDRVKVRFDEETVRG